MSDNTNDKVIELFKRLPKNAIEEGGKFFKGFPYVKIAKDESGLPFKEDYLLEYAKKCFYIVSVVRKNGINTAIYKYKVPYDDLLGFLNEFRTNSNYGSIIDIERYIPEDLA